MVISVSYNVLQSSFYRYVGLIGAPYKTTGEVQGRGRMRAQLWVWIKEHYTNMLYEFHKQMSIIRIMAIFFI